jgi:hypothetical protein
MDTKLLLDNYKLLDAYQSTGYITKYLDDITNYCLSNKDIILPPNVRSNSLLTNQGYELLISHPNHHSLHGGAVYLLLHLDKLEAFNRYTMQRLLNIKPTQLNIIFVTMKKFRLKAILRPSKPYIGISYKNKYR